MEEFYMEADWPEKIARQEEILRYTTFTRKQALELGLKIAELAEKKYKKGAAIRIIEDNAVIFEYKVDGQEAGGFSANRHQFLAGLCGGQNRPA